MKSEQRSVNGEQRSVKSEQRLLILLWGLLCSVVRGDLQIALCWCEQWSVLGL